MIEELVSPLKEEQIGGYKGVAANRWGAAVDFYEKGNLDTAAYDLAIIGVPEERGTENNTGCASAADAVRKELYALVRNEGRFKIVDLGNLKTGQNLTDTYFALAGVVEELLAGNVLPIIIGGSHDLTLAQYMGYRRSGKKINLAVIDERIDLQDIDGPGTDENFLAKIFSSEPNYLGHYIHLGYQSYYADPKSINTLDKLKFECLRLGDVRKNNIEEVEPMVRDADLLSFDINAIKQSDAPAHREASPNGFHGEEACQITRYAGLSDRLTSFGVYGINPSFDHNRQTAQLAAQMVWYFVDGFYSRKSDYPFRDDRELLKYIVDFKDGEYELMFWKSKKSDRWWLQLPGDKKTRDLNTSMMVACSYADYLQACKEELPDRWVKAYERLG